MPVDPGRGVSTLSQSMHSPLDAIVRRAPVACPPETRLRDALATMRAQRIGSMVVANPQTGRPLGIFTLRDLLGKVAVEQCDLEQPIERVMTSPLVTLESHVSAYQAMITMVRHGLHHVVVVEDGRLAGVVSVNDLFNVQRLGAASISGAIQAATDVDSLRTAAEDIRALARNMIEQGVGSEPLTQFISSLNDLLTIRIIELAQARHALPAGRLCWLALGSEGRYEQTISTDQDNALIFDAPGVPADEMRAALAPFAGEVNQILDACGYPLCKGGVMAMNAEWCRSPDEWRRRCQEWINAPLPQALVNAGIFFDFRPLWGDAALADGLREWLGQAIRPNSLLLFHLAQGAAQLRSALGLFGRFVYDASDEFPHTIDLKMHGARPFVDAARVYALAHGVAHTSTPERLRLAAAKIGLRTYEMAAAIEAFHFIQRLRLRRQQAPDVRPGGENRIDPATLNELDRHVLKEAFRQARRIGQRLELDYSSR